jgi:glycosyltransferase involved in cell wall biosynthesis
MTPIRTVLVHNIIAPYRLPLFNALAAHPEIDLHVLFLSETESDRSWDMEKLKRECGFPYTVLPGLHLRTVKTTVHINYGLIPALRQLQPEVIIVVSLSFATSQCMLWAGRKRVPVMAWWAGTPITEVNLSRVKETWRRVLLPRLDGFITYSRAASDYLLQNGVPPSRLFTAGNVTFDAAAFHERVLGSGRKARELRDRLRIGGRPVLLTVGQLIPRKNPYGAVQVYRRLREEHPDLVLLIVGTGPLADELREFAATSGLEGVRFTGHVEPDELPAYYALADCFMHLSFLDHWSQVVGEAMAAGRPVVVSRNDHAAELIEDGQNGILIDPGDLDGVTAAVSSLLQDRELAGRLAGNAYATLLANDLHRSEAVFVDAIRFVSHAETEKDVRGLT